MISSKTATTTAELSMHFSFLTIWSICRLDAMKMLYIVCLRSRSGEGEKAKKRKTKRESHILFRWLRRLNKINTEKKKSYIYILFIQIVPFNFASVGRDTADSHIKYICTWKRPVAFVFEYDGTTVISRNDFHAKCGECSRAVRHFMTTIYEFSKISHRMRIEDEPSTNWCIVKCTWLRAPNGSSGKNNARWEWRTH